MQIFGLNGTDGILVVLFAVLVVLLMLRVGRRRTEAGPAKSGRSPEAAAPGAGKAPDEDALVAVIAAAVAAARGDTGSFRVTGVEPVQDAARPGFNTPVWGHADRLARSLTH
ncbi:MAG: hypothetical protein ACLQMF_04990 [Rectinemataceae bacterium]